MSKSIECQHCGLAIEGYGLRKYCTDRCRWNARSLRNGTTCSICGDPMHVGPGTKTDRPAHNACRSGINGGHGRPSHYDRGCRCDSCRAAKVAQVTQWAKERKARDGVAPSTRTRRIARGVPVENLVCAVCGEDMKTSRYTDGVDPAHNACRGVFQLPQSVRLSIFERDDWMCHLCGERTSSELGRYESLYPTLDHIVPRSKGGSDDPGNLATACVRCNSSRGNRDVDEFLALVQEVPHVSS